MSQENAGDQNLDGQNTGAPADSGNQQPQNSPGGEGDKFDLSSLDPSVQNYIKSLRKEAAGYRTNANQLKTQFEDLQGRLKKVFGGEEEQVDPQEAIGSLQGTAEALQFKNAVLEMAVANSIPASGIPYFEFLLANATNSLQEGEELGEDTMSQIIQEARGKSAPAMTQTSVGTPAQAPGQKSEITVAQFSKMGMSERTRLYQTNPDKYAELMEGWKKTIR